MDHFCYLGFMSAMLSYLLLAALWSPVGKGLTSWLSLRDIFFRFSHFPVWCPVSGVAFDCIGSCSLLSSLLC